MLLLSIVSDLTIKRAFTVSSVLMIISRLSAGIDTLIKFAVIFFYRLGIYDCRFGKTQAAFKK
jgi:hypothetical protein